MGMDEDAYWGELLVGQYLQDEEVAGNFSVYYNLYRKYRTDYQVDAILEGREPEEIRERPRLTREVYRKEERSFS